MYKLPQLSYKYDALEPYIDAQTMEIHYSKHHQTYLNNLNDALSKHPELPEQSIEDLLVGISGLPDDIKSVVTNSGGGYYNHNLYWSFMSPEKTKPNEQVLELINRDLGSFELFKETFSKAALTRFGSGWAWLVLDKTGKLAVYSTGNQDTVISKGDRALLGIDVWEHAYYLKYQNKRAEYIENWWNVVNWEMVSETLEKSLLK